MLLCNNTLVVAGPQLTYLICVYFSFNFNTYDSFLHHCCLSSRHRRHTSRWSVYTFCCCTETVHPHTHPWLQETKTKTKGEIRVQMDEQQLDITVISCRLVQLSFANECLIDIQPSFRSIGWRARGVMVRAFFQIAVYFFSRIFNNSKTEGLRRGPGSARLNSSKRKDKDSVSQSVWATTATTSDAVWMLTAGKTHDRHAEAFSYPETSPITFLKWNKPRTCALICF